MKFEKINSNSYIARDTKEAEASVHKLLLELNSDNSIIYEKVTTDTLYRSMLSRKTCSEFLAEYKNVVIQQQFVTITLYSEDNSKIVFTVGQLPIEEEDQFMTGVLSI